MPGQPVISIPLSLSIFQTLHISLFQYSSPSRPPTRPHSSSAFSHLSRPRRKARSIAFLASHPRESGSREAREEREAESTKESTKSQGRGYRLLRATRNRVNKRKAVGERDVAITPKGTRSGHVALSKTPGFPSAKSRHALE